MSRSNESDSERDGGNTHSTFFGCAVLEESEETRGTDDIDIANVITDVVYIRGRVITVIFSISFLRLSPALVNCNPS